MVLQQLGVGQSPWTIDQLDQLSETAREGPRPVKYKIEIETTHHKKAKDSQSNINNSKDSERNVTSIDCRRGSIGSHAPRETFSTNGNVRKVASSTDSIVSGQVGVAGTKTINIQTAPSIQLH
ncbi:MAG: hypothetical protein EZS28_023726 [Streblomastix strix]|uniref:Uncharacterized protein n=1 Tax=Streblomastix strix TaxID=222440 RepID=A0A5J4VE92_9EUKA|nr:MAG: hypothetical protein EZS28_023726 [Streblomastix strix]